MSEESQNIRVISSRPLPDILIRELDRATEELVLVQRRLQDNFTRSAEEIMSLMGLSPEEGWYLDIENRRFVLVAVDEEANSASD